MRQNCTLLRIMMSEPTKIGTSLKPFGPGLSWWHASSKRLQGSPILADFGGNFEPFRGGGRLGILASRGVVFWGFGRKRQEKSAAGSLYEKVIWGRVFCNFFKIFEELVTELAALFFAFLSFFSPPFPSPLLPPPFPPPLPPPFQFYNSIYSIYINWMLLNGTGSSGSRL